MSIEQVCCDNSINNGELIVKDIHWYGEKLEFKKRKEKRSNGEKIPLF